MKDTLKIMLTILLLAGSILILITFAYVYSAYQNINYKQNIQKIINSFEGKKFKLNCSIIQETHQFVVNNQKVFSLPNPDTIKSVTFKIKPKNVMRTIKSLTYHPIIAIIINPKTKEYSFLKTLKKDAPFRRLCVKFKEKRFKIEVKKIKKEIACDSKEKLQKDYDIDCIYWNKNKQIIGSLGEKISCEYEKTTTEDCLTYIELKKEFEYEKYMNDCKSKCFHVPETYNCKLNALDNLLDNAFETIKFFHNAQSDLIIIYPDSTSKTIETNKVFNDKETKNDLEKIKNFNELDGSVFSSAFAQINDIYEILRMATQNKVKYKKFIIMFSDFIPSDTICNEAKNKNISLIIIKSENITKIPNEFKAGCNIINLGFNDSIEKVLDKFYDSSVMKLVKPENLVIQINPVKPEVVIPGKFTSIERTIAIDDNIRYSPVLIKVDGSIEVNMTISRERCGAVLIENEE